MHRTPRRRAAAALTLASALALAGCGADSGRDGQAGSGEPAAVATTTQLGSVLGDVARCADAATATVMGPGDDPHDFAPSSQQVAQMARAGLVFANGLGLEAGMASALENAAQDGAQVLEVAPRLDPLPFGAGEGAADGHAGETAEEHAAHAEEGSAGAHAGETAEEHAAHAEEGSAGAHDGHDHGSQDPHVWMDVARMARAAEVMGDALAEHTGEDRFADCGRQVRGELEATDAEVREILAAVPEDRRRLIADHDAYGYFAAAYGFEVAGVVVPGGSTDGEPSSQRIAELTQAVAEAGADALVTSAGGGAPTVETIAADGGGSTPVVELYEGGVGPADGEPAGYAEAMLHNARVLADALGE
ncbi:metal ABC transporter substrate-binding protein [Micrococcus endophyticus]|uniref:metal ABC transporter substrate-binding protein n=1 Tax=Micrococcus endophyticus TaxID=455343 RepID=UPI0035A84B1F